MYKICIEDESTPITTVGSVEEINEAIKAYIIGQIDIHKFEGSPEFDEVLESGAPWCFYLDEQGFPLRFDIHKG
jgi:hypothetical protein